MKKLGLIATLLVLFSFLPGIIGCTPSTPTTPTVPTTPTTSTAPTTQTTPTAAFKPLKLKWADYRPAKLGWFGTMQEIEPFLQAVEVESNGRIKFERYFGGSLLTVNQLLDGISQGVADLGYMSRLPGQLPLHDVMRLPPQHGETTAMENSIIWAFVMRPLLYKDEKSMNVRYVGMLSLTPYLCYSAKIPINKMEDFKGWRGMSNFKWDLRMMEKLGAVPINISQSAEGYEALAKGMTDGSFWNWEGPFLFGLTATFKPGYWVDVGGVVRSGGSGMPVINHGVWDRLPKDLQELVDFHGWRWATLYFAAKIDASTPKHMLDAERLGHKYVVWPDTEKTKFNSVKATIANEMIDEMEKMYKRGAECRELYNTYVEAAKRYNPPAPIPIEPQLALDKETEAKWKSAFDRTWGPGSTWGHDYKAYPNQVSIYKLEGDRFDSWK
ncbi:MAG: hypothetical protein V1767_02685 [Chloroflexota bacterium]